MKFPARSYIPLTENSGAAIARCSFTFASAARTSAPAARTSGRESNIVPKSANETADRSTFSRCRPIPVPGRVRPEHPATNSTAPSSPLIAVPRPAVLSAKTKETVPDATLPSGTCCLFPPAPLPLARACLPRLFHGRTP